MRAWSRSKVRSCWINGGAKDRGGVAEGVAMWPILVLRRLVRGLLARSSSDDGVEKAASLAWMELAKEGEPVARASGCGG